MLDGLTCNLRHAPSRDVQEAIGRMYGATLPGGGTRENLTMVKNGRLPGQKVVPERVGGGYEVEAPG